MLLLKLIGNKRLSHMEAYDQEPGLGIFAGLTLLPKSTYMGTYSCRTSEEMMLNFQQEIINHFYKTYPDSSLSKSKCSLRCGINFLLPVIPNSL